MTLLLVLCLLTAVLMAAQDSAGTAMVVAEARNLRRWPGALDASNDFMSRYGAAVTAASVIRWGLWSWETFVIVCVTALTSYFATNKATRLAHRWLPKGAP